MRPLMHPLRPPRRSSLANLHALFFQLDLLLNITGHSLRATPSHDLFQLRGAISSLWPAGMIAWGVSWVAPGQGYAKLLAGHCKASCPGAPLHAPGKQLPQAAWQRAHNHPEILSCAVFSMQTHDLSAFSVYLVPIQLTAETEGGSNHHIISSRNSSRASHTSRDDQKHLQQCHGNVIPKTKNKKKMQISCRQQAEKWNYRLCRKKFTTDTKFWACLAER